MTTKGTTQSQELRKPDSQGRIVIGKEHVDETYNVTRLQNGDILLSPVMVIHKQEQWLFSNLEALESLKRGLAQSKSGETQTLESFLQYADDDIGEE